MLIGCGSGNGDGGAEIEEEEEKEGEMRKRCGRDEKMMESGRRNRSGIGKNGSEIKAERGTGNA